MRERRHDERMPHPFLSGRMNRTLKRHRKPAPVPHPSDHHRTRIVWLIVAGLVAFWGVVAWLCSGEWAV